MGYGEFDSRRYESLREKIQRECIIVYEPEKCYNGYTLFSNYRSTTFYLMNMEGQIIHTWITRPAKIGELLPNGHLIYGHMWHGMVEVDWHSQELWYYPCTQHHDFAVMPNGHIMVLCGGMAYRAEKRTNPEIYKYGEYIPAYFIEVDPKTNEVVWRWEADEHIEELKKVGVKFPRVPNFPRAPKLLDVFHANTCEVLPDTTLGRKDSRFKAGNVVFSYRNLDVVGVIEKETGEIVWAWGPGKLDKQHMPTLIPDRHPITGDPLPGAGHFLIYDNGDTRRATKVVEVDPITEEIVWEYSQKGWWCGGGLGGAERMPNGNTVICEGGTRGRLFEVTPEGEIVWEYLTPYFDGWALTGIRKSTHSIYRCVRYPRQYIEKILSSVQP